jgi:hypothetical protein
MRRPAKEDKYAFVRTGINKCFSPISGYLYLILTATARTIHFFSFHYLPCSSPTKNTITMTPTNFKRILAAGVVSSLMIAAGCHDQPVANAGAANSNNPAEKKIPDNPSRVAYLLTEAKKDIREFDQLCKDSLKGIIPVEGYTIRAEDLLAALGLDPTLVNSDTCMYHHVRVYLGFKKDHGFKLFIVPVEGADLSGPDSTWKGGTDIMLDSTGTPRCRGSKVHLASSEEYVLDLNAPCPTTCSTTSLTDR